MATLVVEKRAAPRPQHLEDLMKRYPDVPAEVVVCEDVTREGVTVTRALLAHVGGKNIDTQHHFTWHYALPDELERDLGDRAAMLRMPTYSCLSGGPYQLRPANINPRLNLGSPYLVDIVEGKPKLLDRATGEEIGDLLDTWAVRPEEYFTHAFGDGTLYKEEVPGALSAFRLCQHWGPEEECRFCDINATARLKKDLGGVSSIAPKNPERVAEAFFFMHQIEDWPSIDPDYARGSHSIHITGGSITTTLHGMTEQEFYLRYVDIIRKTLGGRVQIDLQTMPWTREQELEAKRRGVDMRAANFEVWDPRLFPIICPGKARTVGREEWIRRTLDQVDVFGASHAIPGFVLGVEMAQPWGFKTVPEALRSVLQGVEFFASHGVATRPIDWCPEGSAALAGQVPPPVEYFIEFDRAYYELYLKYDMAPERHHPIGPGSRTGGNNHAWNMGRLVPGTPRGLGREQPVVGRIS